MGIAHTQLTTSQGHPRPPDRPGRLPAGESVLGWGVLKIDGKFSCQKILLPEEMARCSRGIQDWLAAKDQLEYWEKKQMAVARGKAVAVRENKKIFADILAAYFKKDRANNSKIYRVDAFDNVKILTEKDKAISDRGVYNVESGIASLSGSVQITRGKNILRGCSAEVNLNTGISKLFRCPKGNNRVSGSISSKKK